MTEYLHGVHTVQDIKYHIVWITKYRYKILVGKIARRARELLIQGCKARKVTIIEGSIGKEHVHMLIAAPTNIAPSKLVQYLKGRSSKLLQEEFPELSKKYWGQHLWARGYFCVTVGSVTKEMIQNYIHSQFNLGRNSQFQIES